MVVNHVVKRGESASFLMVNGDANLALTIVMGTALVNVILVVLLGTIAKRSR